MGRERMELSKCNEQVKTCKEIPEQLEYTRYFSILEVLSARVVRIL